MTIVDLLEIFKAQPSANEFVSFLQDQPRANVHLKGLSGSSAAVVCAVSFLSLHRPTLVLATDKEEAAYFYDDLVAFLGEQDVLFFPSVYKRSVHYEQVDPVNIVMRTEVLSRFSNADSTPFIVVSFPEAIMETVLSQKDLADNTLGLKVGEKLNIEFITEVLHEYNFEKTDFVFEPGQFAVRGSIIDIYSFSNILPYRIDLFGNEVESIRTFDVENQLSKEKLQSISIIPDTQASRVKEERQPFFSFIPAGTLIWTKNLAYLAEIVDHHFDQYLAKSFIGESGEEDKQEQHLISGRSFLSHAGKFSIAEFSHQNAVKAEKVIMFSASPQPAFSKNFSLLSTNLRENSNNNYLNYILSDSEKQIERLQSIFNELNNDVEEFTPVNGTLHEGFIDHQLKICCYTDHEIFERYHKFHLKSGFIRKDTITLNEIAGLHKGDYVVHVDHGIGVFGGLDRIEINGKMQEAVRLVYKDGDILYVNIHSLHKISKYKGKDSESPKIYKLGTAAWQKLKQSTKRKIKDIARELIALYARRKNETGFRFSTDTYMQQELEASFIYEDTPDQITSTQSIKKDMESEMPMDRLICGDVGFGKTEVAIRAAFKAAADSKQVAVLVPTTVLAFQHFHTFRDRLKNFPVTVDYISRFRSPKEIKQIIEKAGEGKIDILIGTHRIVGQDIKFKDLGLLIVDEEQKFGVATKEKLKKMKINVDTLTLTATPIPRTLQFSLMGARDLSIINTPPPNRYPIITELHQFNADIIREAIEYEVSRNGQVFFVHNRVQNIREVEVLVKKLVPKARVVVGHGQMEGRELENVMLDFIYGDYDVLIATTIIENGLDIPNANTIIINDAHHFGLSDLYQLRGRVGRSNKKAFCYLLAPPMSMLTDDARRRLKALEDFSELGSGFNIALQDLDIRGVGNLLGAEQSGYISDIGYETYHRILDEAIQELKDDEFKDLYKTEENSDDETDVDLVADTGLPESPAHYLKDCHIETDLELLFPQEYISNISERIKLYRELDSIVDEPSLLEYENRLIDRFGELPAPSEELLNVVRLRWVAEKNGFEKIILKGGMMICYFISDPESSYYKSKTFSKVLEFVQKQKRLCQMKEIKNKLILSFEGVNNVKDAISLMNRVLV
ncbi:MAG: transcription-repair coupling factor [Bacteroidia bacterium]|nr:transcription-repair coupling factor [Bacteroidia bacterium]